MSAHAALLKLAVSALDRGDAEGARDLLAAVLVLPEPQAPTPGAGLPELASLASFARAVDASPRTVRRWIAAGRLSGGAVIGQGRGLRIDVAKALGALRSGKHFDAGDAGRAHVEQRSRLRLVTRKARA